MDASSGSKSSTSGAAAILIFPNCAVNPATCSSILLSEQTFLFPVSNAENIQYGGKNELNILLQVVIVALKMCGIFCTICDSADGAQSRKKVSILFIAVVHRGHNANKNIVANIIKFVQMYHKFLQIH